MDITFITGIVAGICSAISMLPQLIKIIKDKKAEDVSIGMLGMMLLGIILWITYGFQKQDVPIIATNSLALVLNSIVIFLRIKYRSRH